MIPGQGEARELTFSAGTGILAAGGGLSPPVFRPRQHSVQGQSPSGPELIFSDNVYTYEST